MQIFNLNHIKLKDLSVNFNINLTELEILLAELLNKPRSYLITNPNIAIDLKLIEKFQRLITQRLSKVPLAYLINKAYFWNLELYVNPAVLIPRRETELLVEKTLEILPIKSKANILELGTGSGAIALAIATERPLANIVATDISKASLQIAKFNAKRLAINKIKFIYSNWWKSKFFNNNPKFDIIISNPPYIGFTEKSLCDPEIFFEPQKALFAAEQGLACLNSIIYNAPKYLKTDGSLLLEHGFNQQSAVIKQLVAAGFGKITGYKDLAGQDRVVIANLAKS